MFKSYANLVDGDAKTVHNEQRVGSSVSKTNELDMRQKKLVH